MKKRCRILKLSLFVIATGIMLFIGAGCFSLTSVHGQGPTPTAYDISSYQGNISDNQASQLKGEVPFMILKAENGGLYEDPTFNNNAQALQDNGEPYGAYDYSVYANADQARGEADALQQRAPGAAFYVNDAEENDAGNDFNDATTAWANEMRRLTNKPIVLYSGLYFMNNNMTSFTRNAYDALWVAAYGQEPNPNYHYDLWQYTDHQYSNALGQYVDASTLPSGSNRPMSFWTNGQLALNNTASVVPQSTPQSKSSVTRPRRKHSPQKPSKPSVVSKKQQNNRKFKNKKSVISPKSSKKSKTKMNRRRSVIKYNQNYYHYQQIKELQITARHGTDIYTIHGKKIGHVRKGTILYVNHFKTYHYRHLGYITRAIGIHWGKPDVFTSNKKYVRWY